MKEKVLVLNMSGVYRSGGFLSAMHERDIPFRELDFSSLEGTECYCDERAMEIIRKGIASAREPLRWIDSGDYHYLSKLLAEREKEPFTLLLLDHHPDDQEPSLGEILSCGGWVSRLKKEAPMLQGVLSVGPEGSFQGAETFLEAFGNLSPRRVYISLDKDVLSRSDARTDWDQGTMRLEEVKAILGTVLGSGAEIAGIDICGELTLEKGAQAEDYSVNLRTNIDLLEFITTYLN